MPKLAVPVGRLAKAGSGSAALHDQIPLPDLAKALLPHVFDVSDGAHDEGHLLRVWRSVEKISAIEGGDTRILRAATLLHDCVWVDKRSQDRPRA